MTKLTRTFITSLIVLGSAGQAHAADDSFTTTIKIDRTASATETYVSIKKQANMICRQQAEQSGYSLGKVSASLVQKCEKEITAAAVKSTKNRMVVALHNEKTGVKGQARLFAKN